MKAIKENVILVMNGNGEKTLVAIIRKDFEVSKKTIIYKVEEAEPEDIEKLINRNQNEI